MRPMPALLVIFIIVPLVEIYLLIQVGGVVGALPTVALVVLTAAIGAFMVRAQGLATLYRVQAQLAEGQLPAMAMLEGAILLVAGALLITPGFFTDTLGFLCLVPRLRQQVIRHTIAKVFAIPPSDPGNRDIVDGVYWREEDDPPR